MSSPGPSGGNGPKKNKVKKKVTKKKKEDDEKVKKDGSATDETASNSDRRDEPPPPPPSVIAPLPVKPQSAGASMRDAAQRILTLALKAEWTAVEGVIKSLEKAVEKAKANTEEEIHLAPLLGVVDPVSFSENSVHCK